MALCRFSFLCNSPTSLHPFPAACSTFSPSLLYLPKPVHFTNLISPFRRTPAPYPFSRASLCSSSSSTMESPPDGYRRNVGICLINDSKKIFLASRLDIPEAWQMPQGGVDENEDLRDAVLRELKEETGVTSAEILAEVPYWLTYDFPPAVREKLRIIWGSDWKGQAQKWFLLKFTGKDEEINLLGDGTEKPEFGEWLWMTPEQVVELAVEFKKPVYKNILEVFSPHVQGDGGS
ncbi:nudix hydrolase 26, chloroplastic-like [Impatiens glandulifera]|uniref:nudix hydrolase 26, chloroplastic-like n=1 Tax=Impatiens glandulifera TaxID=253017 RepID=UPI001FB05C32|nr:nudix hydrolase 26, chloroplastic-like [Impatiens glandulifera]